MTDKQMKRVAANKRRVSVKGVVLEPGPDDTHGLVTIGWERPSDGRDMTTIIDTEGRTVLTEPTYRHGPR